MLRWIPLFVMLICLTLVGCGSQEEKAPVTTAKTPDPAQVVPEKAAPLPHAVVKPSDEMAAKEGESAQTVTEQVAQVAEAVEEKGEAAVTAVEEKAAEATAAVEEKTAEVAQVVEEKTAAAVAQVEEKAAAATAAVSETVQQVKDEAAAVADSVEIPELITLEASYGNITFPHEEHASRLDCTVCHGDAPYADLALTKDTAHPLCRGCHQTQKAGPTGCKDCHKK